MQVQSQAFTVASLLALLGMATLASAENEPQVLVRFECKQLLVWETSSNRYCFDDGSQMFCSNTTFEPYMWHHALYTVNSTGSGHLMVDGEMQQLVVPNNYSDVTQGFADWTGGETFSTSMSPTKCGQRSGPEGPGRSNNCCTARIGQGCETSYVAFEGFIDEVAIWDRAFEEVEAAQAVPLAMPKGFPISVTPCLEDKRVLYARWNSPCQPAAEFMSDSTCDASSRLKTQPVQYIGAAMSAYTGVPWEPPHVLAMTLDGVALDPTVIPMDGGSMTMYGIGFASSAFMQCVVKQADPMRSLEETSPELYYSDGMFSLAGAASGLTRMSPAAPTSEFYDGLPWLHRNDIHHPSNDIAAAYADTVQTKNGSVPVFFEGTSAVGTRDLFVGGTGNTPVGFFEAVTCEVPAVPFPSDQYYLGVSNDFGESYTSGFSGSPQLSKRTFMDYALELNSETSDIALDVDMLTNSSGVLDGEFTLALWFWSANGVGTVLSLGDSNVVMYGNGNNFCFDLKGAATRCTKVQHNNQWNHIMIASYGNGTIQLSYDLNQDVSKTDSWSSDGADSTCSPFLLGGVSGGVLIDEVKVYPSFLTPVEAINNNYHLKEDTSSPALLMMRFTEMKTAALVNSKTGDMQDVSPKSLTLTPTAVPWEPSAMYTVNGEPFSKWSTYTQDISEINVVYDIEGFNFAQSRWSSCSWSAPVDSMMSTAFKETPLDAEIPMYSFSAFQKPNYLGDQRVRCNIPNSRNPSPSQGSNFAVSNFHSLTYGLYSYTGLALQCGEGAYATNQALPALVSGRAYTFSLWVWPYELEDGSSATTVLSIEELNNTTSLTKKAGIGYDGVALFYYDDCVQEQYTSSMAVHRPNEWHFVTFMVDESDTAMFTVDHDTVTFSTGSRPTAAATLSLCADFKVMGEDGAFVPTAFFSGLVDEVQFYTTAEMARDTRCKMSDGPSSLVSYANFNSLATEVSGASITLPSLRGPAYTLMSASSQPATAPWLPANVYKVGYEEPKCAHCGMPGTLKVYGVNLAPSPFLFFGFDGEYVQYSGPGADGAVLARAPCAGGSAVTVQNCYAPGETPAPETTSVQYEFSGPYDATSYIAAHWTMDVSSTMETVNGMMATVKEVSGKQGDVVFPMRRSTMDRNHYSYAAVMLDPEVPLHVPVQEVVTDRDAAVTISVLARLPISDAVSGDAVPAFGAWKLLSFVHDGNMTAVYANSDLLESAFLMQHFTAFAETGVLFEGLEGEVDDIWVFGRALTPCELAQRYASWSYSLDTSASDHLAMVNNVSLPEGLRFTLESWVYPHHADGVQTIFSVEGVDGTIRPEVNHTAPTSVYAVGLKDNYLTLTLSTGCSVEPCSSFLEATGALILPNQWVHIGVSFTGTTAFFYVNGCFKDFVQLPGSVVFPASTVTMLIGGESTYGIDMPKPFHGLVDDLLITSKIKEHDELAAGVVCDVRSAWTEGTQYWRMNEGSFALAGDGSVSLPTTAMWRDISEVLASSTEPSMTQVNGNMASMGYNNVTSQYVVTAHDSCGRQRLSGGDSVEVVMSKGDWSGNAQVVDTQDGHYHVYYNRDMLDGCGDYNTQVLVSNETVASFNTALAPMTAVRNATYALEPLSKAAVNTMHRIVIQTVDRFGCAANGTDETFEVLVTGPETKRATVIPGPGGRYTAMWIPLSNGTYHVTINMTSGHDVGLISNPYHCVEVSMGHTFTFNGADALVVEEETISNGPAGTTELDLTFPALTISSWVRFSGVPSADAYLVFKGDMSQVGEYIKGYQLVYNATTAMFSASVYCGGLRVRSFDMASAQVDTSSAEWFHIAVVYDSSSWTGMVNGAVTDVVTFDLALPPQPNMYYHPMMMGYGLVGALDDVTLWKVSRSAADFAPLWACGIFAAHGEEVQELMAARFTFDDDILTISDGSVRGMGSPCTTNPDPDCLKATYIGDVSSIIDTRSAEDHPLMGELPYSMHVIADSYAMDAPPTQVVGTNSSWFPVFVMNGCGFLYAGGEPFDVTYTLTNSSGVAAVFPLSRPASVCSALETSGDVHPLMGLGAVYNATANLTKAGIYSRQIDLLPLGLNDTSSIIPLLESQQIVEVMGGAPTSINASALMDTMVAGTDTPFHVTLLDKYNNTIKDELRMFSLTFTLVAEEYAKVVVYYAHEDADFDASTGIYSFNVSLCHAGSYMLDVVAEYGYGIDPQSSVVTVEGSSWETMANTDSPHESLLRFQHAGVTNNGMLYIFGGALSDKTVSNDLLVAHTHGGKWETENATGVPPSPRYSHTAVAYSGAMYVFGGQRSQYAFNEVHVYDFESRSWSYVTPSTPPPSGRYDHSAVVIDDVMLVYGGRNATVKFMSDMWVFNFSSHAWSLLADDTLAGARFGHSAASPEGSGKMYVFGGYSDVGLSNDLFMCDLYKGECFDYTYGCGNRAVVANQQLAPESLTPRLGHSSAADGEFVYIIGGTNLTSTVGYSSVYMFSHQTCSWDMARIDGEQMGRYDHLSWLTEEGLFVQGGKRESQYMQDTYFLPMC